MTLTDRDYEISFGRDRTEKNWKIDYLTWSEFIDRLRDIRRTGETMAQYDQMTKDKQGTVKDGPAFIGGSVRGGRRTIDNVEERTLITLDADYADDDFLLMVDLILGGSAHLIYSTHSHRPNRPKYRITAPTDRAMTPDEYAAVSRKVAEQIGMHYFDKTTFEVHRLMYFPSCSKDAEPVFEVIEGDPLSVDFILDEYTDWQDSTEWPRHPDEEKALSSKAGSLKDPRDKNNSMISTFNKAYDIHSAIETFLQHKYERTPGFEDRYTYIEGTSSGGVRVYPDNDDPSYMAWAYSEHASDPANTGHCIHSFDLVRVHLYGHLDADAKEGTPNNKLPSFNAMSEKAAQDKEVKKILAKIRDEEFGDIWEDHEESEDEDWESKLEVNAKNGTVKSNSRNLQLILSNPPFKGVLAYDAFKNAEVIKGPLPWRELERSGVAYEPWLGSDDRELRHYLGVKYDIKSANMITDSFTHAIRKNKFHPIKEYVEEQFWDGTPRLETLFIDYLGATDTPYVRAVTSKMFIAAVKRLYEPGCKFDEMLVIVGPQGCGKSTILAKMGRQWFCDSLKSFDSKEAGEYLQSSWIFEFGELAAMKKAEIEEVKVFASKTIDMYRVAYDRTVSEFPRKCVFFGTTNNLNFLKDDTGNRRFWPIVVHPEKRTKNPFSDLSSEVINQIWAEAKHLYDRGEPVILSDELKLVAEEIQQQHMEDDPRVGMIQEYLESPINDEFGEEPKERTRVCAAEIWVECLGNRRGDMKPWDAKPIIDILRKTPGWEEKRMRFGPEYGVQNGFVKIK